MVAVRCRCWLGGPTEVPAVEEATRLMHIALQANMVIIF